MALNLTANNTTNITHGSAQLNESGFQKLNQVMKLHLREVTTDG